MKSTPCDIHEYNSDEYKKCIKDIVYESVQDEWVMLDPRFPDLKGITPERIDEFLADVYKFYDKNKRDYYEDYLQHVMVYDRDDIIIMCKLLGEQTEEKYPGKLHSNHSIFITTPRGGHEVLSIFAYTNDLKKEQIPSHIKGISDVEYRSAKYDLKNKQLTKDERIILENLIKHKEEKNEPIIPYIWLTTFEHYIGYVDNRIETIFIIDDIIASGAQMSVAHEKVNNFFKRKIEIIPIVLVKRKDVFTTISSEVIFNKTFYVDEIVGIEEWDRARQYMKPGRFINIDESMRQRIQIEKQPIYDSLITVRFPWGSPDGESDAILTSLYEGRRGLERVEKKQRRCKISPDKCELK